MRAPQIALPHRRAHRSVGFIPVEEEDLSAHQCRDVHRLSGQLDRPPDDGQEAMPVVESFEFATAP